MNIPSLFTLPLVIITLILFEIIIIIIYYDSERIFTGIANIITISLITLYLIILSSYSFNLVHLETDYIRSGSLIQITSAIIYSYLLIFIIFVVYRIKFDFVLKGLNKNQILKKFGISKWISFLFILFLPLYFFSILFIIYFSAIISGGHAFNSLEVSFYTILTLIDVPILLFSIYLYIDSNISNNNKGKKFFSIIFIYLYLLFDISCFLSQTMEVTRLNIKLGYFINLLLVLFIFVKKLVSDYQFKTNESFQIVDNNDKNFLMDESDYNSQSNVKNNLENELLDQTLNSKILIVCYIIGYVTSILFSIYSVLISDLHIEMYISLIHSPIPYFFRGLFWPLYSIQSYAIVITILILWNYKRESISDIFKDKDHKKMLINLLLLFPLLIHIFWIIIQMNYYISNNLSLNLLIRMIFLQFIQIEFFLGWNLFVICYTVFIYIFIKGKYTNNKINLILLLFLILYFILYGSFIYLVQNNVCEMECRVYFS